MCYISRIKIICMKFYIADCFAEAKYQGNQLAVLIPDRPVDDGEMQRIAIETGFSETAFIMSGRRSNGGYDVRIFTTSCEVPFAGHPTLGTAYVIREILESGRPSKVILNLKAGQIPVEFTPDGRGIMTQNQPVFGEVLPREAAVAAVSLSADDVREDFPVQWVSTGLEAVITPLKSVEALERCRVNYDERQRFIDRHYACSLLYFAPSEDGSLRVRVFMEDPGFLEDPATGSANGDLACWLLRYGFFGDRRSLSYTVSQGSEMGRPSRLYVDAAYDPVSGLYSTQVGGRVFLVAEGEWR